MEGEIKMFQKIRKTFTCLSIIFLLIVTAPPIASQEQLGQGRINGTVVDDEGNPVEGALIAVESMKNDKRLEVYSDNKGRFAVGGLWGGFWRVTASKKGYNPSSIELNVRQLRRNPPISFTLNKMEGFAALLADDEAFQLFEKGNKLSEEEKYDEAQQVFEEFLTKYPDVYQVHLNIGQNKLKKGELDEAAADFQLVLDKTLENYGDYKTDTEASLRAFTGLGEVYIQKQDLESAMKYFRQALDISPRDEVAALNVGEILFSNQKIDEAIHYYELAIEIKNDWSKPYLKLGYVYLNKAEYDKAIEYFNKFIEMDPENPEVPTVKNIVATIEKIKE
jgi:tetratricopeptide (TPR) repeat protein